MSIAEYLRTSDFEPDAEYVDGVIEERPVGEFDHASWQGAIHAWFFEHRRDWNIHALIELRIQVSPTRVRVPDVAILKTGQAIEQVPTKAPLAVFEVMSPEDRRSCVMSRLQDFETMGVPQIWVVDPATEAWRKFVNGGLVSEEEFVQGPIRFHIREIASRLDL